MCGQEMSGINLQRSLWKKKTVMSVAVGLLSATLQVLVCSSDYIGMDTATPGWLEEVPYDHTAWL